MLRVAIDGAPLLGRPTGVGGFTKGMLRALADVVDLRVDSYALSGRAGGALASLLPRGVNHIGLPMPARPLLDIWKRWPNPPIELWTRSVDVVHGTNFVVPPTHSAAAVVTIHDLTAIRYPEMCTPTTLKYPALIRRAVQRGSHVHVMTQAIANEVQFHFDVDNSHLHVVPPGVPVIQAGTAGPSEVDYILALGTIEPRKDYPLLVQAFDEIASDNPDLELWIVGSRGWGAKSFEDALHHAKFSSRVRQFGWVDDQQRANLLRNAKALAYPSIYEGFGVPPLEAMSVGVPVVATKIDAVAEVSGDAAWLIPPGDRDALADALQQAVSDEDQRTRMIEAGLRRVDELSWSKFATDLSEIYRRISKS